MTTPAASPDPRHTQLRTWYDQLTARIAASDKDIGRALSELDRQIHRERLADLTADREVVTTYLNALERGQSLPGPWPPKFQTGDLLAASPSRILFKSGRHDFYRHIPLPPNYIPRPELLAEVRERLLAGTVGLALTSAIQVKQADVLHGMGGIGKSVLARALCDDPDVQAAFPDGILWATLGQTPDLTARLREWIETLGGIVGQTAPTLDQLRNTLAEALRDRACLLIVDDAWRKAHLEPFCAGGSSCRRLITTRDAALAEGLDAGVYPVPVMAPDQAVVLLEEWAGAEVEAKVKAEIVKQLGYLPLAVRLAGAQLREKDPVEWLASFDARKLKTRRVEAVHDSLEATFGLSLDALSPADRRLYVALAIFKEEGPIPVVAIARLWSALDGRNAEDADELLTDLADRALLARSHSDGNAVTVHDLLRDFMAAELGEEGRIAAHRALLDAYRRSRQGGGWHTVPDDGYFYDHLAYHLDQLVDHDASAEDDLFGLFDNQGWLHARILQSGYLYDGYLADLRVAWLRSYAVASRQIDADQEPSALADCVRYALIRGSINSLASQYDPFLVVSAVATGLWSAPRAINIAIRISDAEQRADALTYLLTTDRLQPAERSIVQRFAFEAILCIGDSRRRAIALGELACLADIEISERLIQAESAAMIGISDKWIQIFVAAALIRHLPQELREPRIQRVVSCFDDLCEPLRSPGIGFGISREDREFAGISVETVWAPGGRARALAALLPYLDKAKKETAITKALEFAQKTDLRRYALSTLIILAPNVPDSHLNAFLKLVADNTCRWPSVEKCATIASTLSHARDAQRKELETTLLGARPEIERQLQNPPQIVGDAPSQVVALAKLSSGVSAGPKERLLATALDILAKVRDETERVLSIAMVAPLIPDRSLAGKLADEAARLLLSSGPVRNLGLDDDFEPPSWWSRWIGSLVAIMPFLSDKIRKQAVAASFRVAREMWDTKDIGLLLTALVPYVGEDERDAVTEDAVKQVLNIEDASTASRILAKLARQLEIDAMARTASIALQTATAEPLPVKRATKLALLVPYLPPEVRGEIASEIIQMVNSVLPVWQRAVPLVLILPYLNGQNKQTAESDFLQVAAGIGDSEQCAQLLTQFVLHLTGMERRTAIQNSVAVADQLDQERTRAPMLAALAAAQSIQDRRAQAWALAGLVRDGEDRYRVLPHLRRAMLDYIYYDLMHRDRSALLWFCADQQLFRPPILSSATLTRVAKDIIKICQEWEWL